MFSDGGAAKQTSVLVNCAALLSTGAAAAMARYRAGLGEERPPPSNRCAAKYGCWRRLSYRSTRVRERGLSEDASQGEVQQCRFPNGSLSRALSTILVSDRGVAYIFELVRIAITGARNHHGANARHGGAYGRNRVAFAVQHRGAEQPRRRWVGARPARRVSAKTRSGRSCDRAPTSAHSGWAPVILR